MKIQWMWEDDPGGVYKDFDEDLNNLLEFFFTRRNINYNGSSFERLSPPIASFTIPSYTTGMKWTFNFDQMTQTSNGSLSAGSRRKIIRAKDGKVWTWYDNTISGVSQFYFVNDISILNLLDLFNPSPGYRSHKNPPDNITYVSTNPSRTITCRDLKNNSSKQECDGNVTIELVDVNTLRPPPATQQYPQATAAAPQYQPQPQYPSQAAAVVTQQQSPLPAGWIEHISPGGIPFYVYTPTGQSFWDRPLPSGWIEKYDMNKRKYYENSVSGLTQWTRPQGGGKTGKKKKRIIKRQKTYKNKRYTKRKTIKR